MEFMAFWNGWTKKDLDYKMNTTSSSNHWLLHSLWWGVGKRMERASISLLNKVRSMLPFWLMILCLGLTLRGTQYLLWGKHLNTNSLVVLVWVVQRSSTSTFSLQHSLGFWDLILLNLTPTSVYIFPASAGGQSSSCLKCLFSSAVKK